MHIRPELKAHYDGYYDGVSAWRRAGAVGKAENIRRLCGALGVRTLVDIGCGDGAVLERLAADGFGATMDGFDVSTSAIEAVRSRPLPGLARAEVFDGARLPVADQAYDLAVLSHVVEHLEHPRALIREAARVARRVFIEVPLEDTWRHPADYRPSPVGHINHFSHDNLRRLVQTCGLRVVAQRIAQPPLACARMQAGALGVAGHLLKGALLAACPRLAMRMACYHLAVLAEPDPAMGLTAPG